MGDALRGLQRSLLEDTLLPPCPAYVPSQLLLTAVLYAGCVL